MSITTDAPRLFLPQALQLATMWEHVKRAGLRKHHDYDKAHDLIDALLRLRLPQEDAEPVAKEIARLVDNRKMLQKYLSDFKFHTPEPVEVAYHSTEDDDDNGYEPVIFQGLDLEAFLHGPRVRLPKRFGWFHVGDFPYTKAFSSLSLGPREDGGIWIKPHHDHAPDDPPCCYAIDEGAGAEIGRAHV